LFREYIFLFYFLLSCFFLVFVLLFCSIFFVNQNPDSEKLSAYECGFNPYEDARSRFEIRFFLVGILFIVFDSEVAYLLP
jgi:NADH-quinone oxidoreductase subunit A